MARSTRHDVSAVLALCALLIWPVMAFGGADRSSRDAFRLTSVQAAEALSPPSSTPLPGLTVDGQVEAIVSKADGTTFIGGTFTHVSGVSRNRVAAIGPDGTLLPFDPNADGFVTTLALSPDEATLYVGGTFWTIGKQSRHALAAVAVSTGLATPFKHDVSNVPLRSIAVSPDGSRVYVGSGGAILLALDAKTGLTLWGGANSCGTVISGTVFDLALSADGTILFVGGEFNVCRGLSRTSLAAVNTATGTLTGWYPHLTNAPTEPTVLTLALSPSGATLYVGGAFLTVGGLDRLNVAAIDTTTGATVGWNPILDGDVSNATMSPDGSAVYLAGSFANVNGVARRLAAGVGAQSAAVNSWAPFPQDAVGYVYLSQFSGGRLAIGGNFTEVGNEPADHYAIFAGPPTAPLSVQASGDDQSATVSWSPPASDGSSPIVEYTVVADPGGASCSSSSLTCQVNGLSNGTPYKFAVVAMNAIGAGLTSAWSTPVVPVFPFTDIGSSPFYGDIVWIFRAGITTGCAPTTFCPDDVVTRGQMAAFLDRALHLPKTTTDYFTDDGTSIFEASINRIATAGITKGCTATTFCPNDAVTRGQMAAFLDRALHLPKTTTDYFTDDNSSIFEQSINRLAASGITTGCSPTTFCPGDVVTRGQMAAFLHRALK